MMKTACATSFLIAFLLVTLPIEARCGEALSLEQVIREVSTKSDSVKMMRESVKKSDEMVREKWSNVYPLIAANATTARSRGSAFGGGMSGGSPTRQIASRRISVAGLTDTVNMAIAQFLAPMFESFSEPQQSTIYSAGISVSQPIYTFGKVGTAIKVAEQYNKSAHFSFDRNLQLLQLQAFDAFFQTLLAAQSGKIAKRSLERKRELNGFLERNFEMGAGSRAQVLATRADLAGQSAQTIIARRDARSARMYLNAFMGRPLDDATPLDTGDLLDTLLEMNLPSAEVALDGLAANRADLQALRLLAQSNRGGAKIFSAMYLPSIGASGSVGYSKYESDAAIFENDGTANWTVGIGLSWTLFDGFANSAKAAQFRSDADKLDIACDALERLMEIEVRSALDECVAADSAWSSARDMVASASEGYELTQNNFKEGSGQFADLQFAEVTLAQAELGLVNARYRRLRSRAALRVALGSEIIPMTQEEK